MNVYYIFASVIMLMLGIVIGDRLRKRKQVANYIGVITVDSSDPDSQPYLFLSIESGKTDLIKNQAYVTMKVEIR